MKKLLNVNAYTLSEAKNILIHYKTNYELQNKNPELVPIINQLEEYILSFEQ